MLNKTIYLLVPLLLMGIPLGAQEEEEEEKTAIELQQVEPRTFVEQESALIGLEAFREVLESGRYLVGPEDEFLVYVNGMEEPIATRVLAEGGVFIPHVGNVKIGGLSLRLAREKVEEAFRQTVKVGNIVFELSQPRFFPVPVLGIVLTPGLKGASGIERVSQVLSKAGPSMPTASRRNIRVFKTSRLSPEQRSRIQSLVQTGDFNSLGDVESHRVDLMLYEVTGNSGLNPFVEDGDIILVPPQLGQVGALGGVQRSSFYEFVPGDRISDLLALALGPTPSYDPEKVQLFRYSEDMITRVAFPVDLKAVLAGDSEADLLLREDDWLNVRAKSGYHQRSEVRITGEVLFPGYYVVEPEGTTLREVIERAGGFTELASLVEARVVRHQVPVEAGKDPEFARLRTVPVSDRTEDDNQYFIMKSREKPGQMVINFAALFDNEDESQNIQLMPGDVIVIPALQSTVTVSGQAAQPGAVIYAPSLTVWDYIERAGGLGWRASDDIRVIKARTGEMKRAKDVVQIDPGDRIWIKEKPQRDYWSIFTQAMGVIGQVSTVVLLYATLTN